MYDFVPRYVLEHFSLLGLQIEPQQAILWSNMATIYAFGQAAARKFLSKASNCLFRRRRSKPYKL